MATPLYFPKFRALDANGNPLASGKLYTYSGGTSAALATYTDATYGTANANPVILDANGEAAVWPLNGLPYKFILKDASDVTQWTMDNVTVGGAGAATIDLTSPQPNLLDNGGSELAGSNRAGAAASGASATCFTDRWWGYRGGQTGYTIAHLGGSGLPNRINVQRDSGNANTTTLVIGQHCGKPATGTALAVQIDRLLNPLISGLVPNFLVFSCYVYKGANFSGSGVTLEIVTNSGDTNICSGAGWTVEASATYAAADILTSWKRLYVVKSGALTNSGSIGVRVKFNSPSGTAGADDAIVVTGAKMEVNTTGTPTMYEVPTPEESLRRAKRFYQQFGGASNMYIQQSYGAASAFDDHTLVFPVEMVKAPTASVAGTWGVVNCSQPSVPHVDTRNAILRTTVTALGAFSFSTNGTDDLLKFDAETA